MKYISLILILTLMTFYTKAQNLRIEGGWLIITDSSAAVKNKILEIRSGKIYAIKNVEKNSDTPTIRLTDNDYVLPGLFDLHGHLKVVYGGISKEDTLVTPILYLANGITTIFTCGDVDPEAVIKYKRNVNKGIATGPTILNSGPYFGHQNEAWNDSLTKKEIYDKVDYWATRGIDGIKVKSISATHLGYVIERAHSHNLSVTGHLNHTEHPGVGSETAIPLGIDRLEHYIGGEALQGVTNGYTETSELDLSDPAINKAMDLFIDHKVFFNSTLTVIGGFVKSEDKWLRYWIDEKKYWTPYAQSIVTNNTSIWNPPSDFYEKSKILLKRFYDKGGLISMGTDGPLILDGIGVFQAPGFNTHREMAMMAEIGIPNHEVIKIASLNSARAMGLSDKFGSIEPGKYGDLMIIKGNPLEDIYNTRNVHTVIKKGVVYDTQELLKTCEGKLGPNSEEVWFGK